MPVLDHALNYLRAGLSVLPADAVGKRPAVASWKEYQERRPTEDELRTWFARDRALCLVTGKVSGNLEMIDFDCAGEKFAWWKQLVEHRAPGLLARLVIERSPSGGWHVVYRCATPPCGNIKLAERAVPVADDREVEFYGRKYKPRVVNGRHEVWLTLIETRAEGGLFLCAPSPNYELAQGQFEAVPLLSDQEREVLLEAAWSQNELRRLPEPVPEPLADSGALDRPGDDYNARGDVRGVLRKHGWTLARQGENEYWRRPGKTDGWSATFKEGVFFVHSSNAAPFEPGRPYAPFAVYTLLEHGGDFTVAATALRHKDFGGESDTRPKSLSTARGRHRAARMPATNAPAPDEVVNVPDSDATNDTVAIDPGALAPELLDVPGFVADVMDYTLNTAPYPNRPLAFVGALALQAVLAGRKIREPGNLRTNLMLLALAHSGVGKDWPRKVNARILLECGEARKLAGKSASGEGIEDRLLRHPIVLKQDDEVDTMFANMADNADPRYRNQLAMMLELYGEAGAWRVVRDKADRQSQIIHQPHLVLFGTTTPAAFYESMSARLLNKGMLGRLTTVEADSRQRRQRATWPDLPKRILQAAKWWSEFRPPNWGNLSDESVGEPRPLMVPLGPAASAAIDTFADECDQRYHEAEQRNDEAVMAIWARAVERATQLALVHACSVQYESPEITLAGVRWASDFVRHSTLRTIFMLGQHFHESDFEGNCNAVFAKLQAWAAEHGADAWMPHRTLRKRLKRLDAKQFDEAWEANVELERIETRLFTSGGRPTRLYRVLVGGSVGLSAPGGKWGGKSGGAESPLAGSETVGRKGGGKGAESGAESL
jgi:hypothetical protein